MATQTQTGKAFEYALINETYNILTLRGFIINLTIDSSYNTALACYNVFNARLQSRYSKAAITAIEYIITLEPRLVTPQGSLDILTLQLQPDSAGANGDVRDLLFIRSNQNWEIGVSAKNNHTALKHSRLSNVKDFGNSWVGIPCSPSYFTAINQIFTKLSALKSLGTAWKNVPNSHVDYYQPLLAAFVNELTFINSNNARVPQALISYLVGKHDFYKIIKKNKEVLVYAFNIHGTLGKSINGTRSLSPVRKLALPTQIVQFKMVPGLAGTLSMICDQGWQISFRIHSAETLVIPSLKFDVNLVGNPATMHTNHLAY